MKNKVKKIIATIGIIILATPLVSCGGVDKTAPEEVVKAYVGTYLKSKDVDYKKAKVDKDTADTLANKRDYNVAAIFKCDEEEIESDFLKTLYSALSKVKYNVTSSDVEKDTAKVNLEVKGLNLDSLKKDVFKATEEEKKKKKMNVEEYLKCYYKVVIDNLNNINLDERKTIELELDKDSDEVWKLTDDSLTKLESAITEKDSYKRLTEEIPDSFKDDIKKAS